MDSSWTIPSPTEQPEAEPRSRLTTLLQLHVAPGYAVGGRWCHLEDTALPDRDSAMKAEGWAEGWAERVAASVPKVLEARGIPVSEAQRQEILGCQDLDRLDLWLSRAAVASSADEVTSEP